MKTTGVIGHGESLCGLFQLQALLQEIGQPALRGSEPIEILAPRPSVLRQFAGPSRSSSQWIFSNCDEAGKRVLAGRPLIVPERECDAQWNAKPGKEEDGGAGADLIEH